MPPERTAKKVVVREIKKRNYGYNRKYYEKYPWKKVYFAIRCRCFCKSDTGYKFYGAKGIKCLVTMEDIRAAWFRDKASRMKRPSIDRIDPFGHYTPENIRFIEFYNNRRGHRRNGRKVYSVDIATGEIKKYLSPNQAEILDGFNASNIRYTIKGQRSHCGGKKWFYEN